MATEAEFKSGSGIQHALMFHKRAIVVLDVTHAVVIPCIRASDTDIRDDAEYTLVVDASKAVEHVPCDFKVHIGIFHFFPQLINVCNHQLIKRNFNIVQYKLLFYHFIKFVLEIFSGTGYEMQFDKCCQCGGAFNTHIILDFDLGNLVCGLCKGNNCLEIQPANYYVLKLISKTPFDRLSSIKFNDKIFYELVDALISNFEFRFGKKLKSLS